METSSCGHQRRLWIFSEKGHYEIRRILIICVAWGFGLLYNERLVNESVYGNVRLTEIMSKSE